MKNFVLRSHVAGFVFSLLFASSAHAAPLQKDTAITYSQRHMLWIALPKDKQDTPFLPVNAADMQWSTDGKQLAFINTTSNELETVDSTGHNRQIIARSAICDKSMPEWSTDATRVAFACSRTHGSRAQSAVFSFEFQTARLKNISGWSPNTSYRAPSWSPDNNKLAYEAFGSDETQIVVADPARHIVQPLVNLSDITTTRQISWSPNGKKILYNDSQDEIYTIWVDGSHRSVISDGESHEASWSPDGTRIVFIEDPTDNTLSISELDGSIRYIPLEGLTANKKDNPQWSPDGTKIAFTMQGISGGLFTVDLTSNATTKMAAGSIEDFDWKPSTSPVKH